MSEWKRLCADSNTQYKVFRNGKVGHVVDTTNDAETKRVFRAFYDGIFLGSHFRSDEAALAIELLSGDHG